MGGSARVWTGQLPADPAPAALDLGLTMTKNGAPVVRIGYEIWVE